MTSDEVLVQECELDPQNHTVRKLAEVAWVCKPDTEKGDGWISRAHWPGFGEF